MMCIYMEYLDSEQDKIKKTIPSDPSTIKKFVDPLSIPVVARPNNPYDYEIPRKPFYSIEMIETKHRFHRYFPLTTV